MSSSIVYQFPYIDFKKFKVYEFPIIEEAILQEKSVSKYEIPQYIQDIPDGFSIFSTLWEASKIKQYMLLSEEEQNKLNAKENLINKDQNPICFNEPLPKTNFCFLCQRRFDDYYIHIETMIHKNNLTKNPIINNAIDTFKRINEFWEKEKKEEKKLDIENKNFGASISSLSTIPSTNSLLKSENSNYFLINLETLENRDHDINDKDKENNYSNQNCENKENKAHYSLVETNERKSLILLKKKRKGNMNINKDKESSKWNQENIVQSDYFNGLNINKTKKLIGEVNLFFK